VPTSCINTRTKKDRAILKAWRVVKVNELVFGKSLIIIHTKDTCGFAIGHELVQEQEIYLQEVLVKKDAAFEFVLKPNFENISQTNRSNYAHAQTHSTVQCSAV
jgi:hypothetical protein